MKKIPRNIVPCPIALKFKDQYEKTTMLFVCEIIQERITQEP
jgi:hypothetical protein